MKLALVVTPENPVPPTGYGGGERVANTMVLELMKRGHEVDLYAAPGSTCPATNLVTSSVAEMGAEKELVAMIAKAADQYDAIIDRAAFHITAQGLISGKVIGLMCGDPFKRYPHDTVQNRVYVSKEFAEFWGCPDHPVLMNPLTEDPELVPLGKGGKYALFVGPIHPMKGIHVAAAVCSELEMEFKVYGPVRDKQYLADLETFSAFQYCGELGQEGRDKVFGRAKVFLHTATVCDADPGAPKEAMLRGTPVVCSNNGGIISRIKPFHNGFVCDNVEMMYKALMATEKMDRTVVRQTIMDKADPSRYGEELEALCVRVTNGDRWNHVRT